MKNVALCIDDLGLHESVLRAASELAALGRVQAMGLQVGAPAAAEAATTLASLRSPDLEIGLHFDLTEHPLPPDAPRPLRGLILDALRHRLDAAMLDRQAQQQLDRFAEQTGFWPDFIDGHQHVHQLPMVRDALLAAIDRRRASPTGRSWTPWLRHSGPPPGEFLWLREPKAAVIGALGADALRVEVARRGLGQNRALLGVYDFQGDEMDFERRLDRWWQAADDGDLLMCHPAAAPVPADPISQARCREFAVLRDTGLLQSPSNELIRPMTIGSWLRAGR